jgi:serine phosphatase RsbU (regulator of sigma subunit)
MLNTGAVFYLSTDGYIDQAGGVKRMAFSRKRLIEYIKENWQKSMQEQRDIFQDALMRHQGNIPQRDDITLIGFRVA